ncbi:MAG TPA: xanthine dehydrogenase family protein molybdopterin-binding subunit [Acidimicrobiia bacterium]|nr:xanthine dehydrogenase family protein molybdopterin-binding subunit [Acidimicrobiia bacterium]
MSASTEPIRRRLEDRRFVTGAGRYVSDLIEADDLHAHFYRSPVAHGMLGDVDIDVAADLPGVASIHTGADIDLPPIGGGAHAGEARFERPLLATGRVRYVGEPIAVVLAGTKTQAVDAAGMIWADIEPLDVVTDPRSAAHHAVTLFEEGNVAFRGRAGSDPSDREFPLTATVTVHNQRLATASIEGLAIHAAPTRAGGLVVHCGHQAPHRLRTQLASQLGLDPTAVRVVVPDVGGAFGMKGMLFPEYVVVAAAAMRLGRPVAWIEERREHFQGGTHGRGQTHTITLEGDADGRIRRARIEIVADLGAYPHTGSHIPHLSTFVAQGLYDIGEVTVDITGVVTNLAPTGSYRGAGRPEAAFAIERAVDEFAAVAGLDPVAVRRKNFVSPDQLPYANRTGATYDSGDYARALDIALDMVDIDSARAEQERRRREGDDPIGVGIGAFVERAGGATGTGEFGHVRVGADGRVEIMTGSTSAGQGHETVWPQLVAPMFGIAPDEIVVMSGDTGLVAEGVGTFASRSAQLTGSALVRMAEAVVTEMKQTAASVLETSAEDLVLAEGRVHVAGDPQSGVTFAELAGTESSEMFVPESQAFPFGSHVAVVEVSLATGEVAIQRYVAVDDCGNVLNPMIVHGQVVGSLVQGYGQAVLEGIEYSESGDPVTASFIDYLIPAAMDTPTFTLGRTYTPAPSNPLGVKGTGEAGCIGAPPAIVNAPVDALRPYGVTDLQMPLRPHRVWEAVRKAWARGD